jgi:hypothetical protein
VPTHFLRGSHYIREGDYDRVISDFDQALGLDPKVPAPTSTSHGHRRCRRRAAINIRLPPARPAWRRHRRAAFAAGHSREFKMSSNSGLQQDLLGVQKDIAAQAANHLKASAIR